MAKSLIRKINGKVWTRIEGRWYNEDHSRYCIKQFSRWFLMEPFICQSDSDYCVAVRDTFKEAAIADVE